MKLQGFISLEGAVGKVCFSDALNQNSPDSHLARHTSTSVLLTRGSLAHFSLSTVHRHQPPSALPMRPTSSHRSRVLSQYILKTCQLSSSSPVYMLTDYRLMMKKARRKSDRVRTLHIDRIHVTNVQHKATRRSPRKTEKKPVYVLDLIIPPRQVDNCLEPAKSAVHLQVRANTNILPQGPTFIHL